LLSSDAAWRHVWVARGARTSTPLQALVLLNGPQFVEAARALAARVAGECGADESAALSAVFRVLTGRAPARAEEEVLLRLHAAELRYFAAEPQRAAAYLGAGDSASARSPSRR
jgi:hypothetical protein